MAFLTLFLSVEWSELDFPIRHMSILRSFKLSVPIALPSCGAETWAAPVPLPQNPSNAQSSNSKTVPWTGFDLRLHRALK